MASRRLALFDFDGTMVKGDSIGSLVNYFRAKGLLSFPGHLRLGLMALLWKLGLIKVEQVKTLALAPLSQLNGQEVQIFLKAFVKEKLVPSLFKDAMDQMNWHAEAGDTILLVSASPKCYLQYLAEALPVSGIIGTMTDEQYQITRNVVKEEKVQQIRLWLDERQIDADWAESTAYGNSANDLPMLQAAGKPFLVNPKAKALYLGKSIPVKRWA